MAINQDAYSNVNEFVNQICQKSYGLREYNFESMIDLGTQVLSSVDTTNNFIHNLVDRIGKTVIRGLNATLKLPFIVSDFEMGLYLQKIYVKYTPSTRTSAYENGGSYGSYEIKLPEVNSVYYTKVNPWQNEVTVSEHQLKKAFNSAADMAAFINAIRTTLFSSLEVQAYYNGISALTFLAYKASAEINLISEFNSNSTQIVTAENCFNNINFVQFLKARIRQIEFEMKNVNNKFLPTDNIRDIYSVENVEMAIINKYYNRIICQSNSLYSETTPVLQNAFEIVAWQSIKEGENDKYAIDNGDLGEKVLGVIYDKEAIWLNNQIVNQWEDYKAKWLLTQIGNNYEVRWGVDATNCKCVRLLLN